MSVLILLRPPTYFRTSTFSVPLTMPVPIAYLAASLLKAGHQVRAVDALGEALSEVGSTGTPGVFYRGLSTGRILDRIGPAPDAIGVSAMFESDWTFVKQILAAIRERYPGVPIVVGGEHATAAPAQILREAPFVTCVCCGEGEQTIVEFADYLDGRLALEDIAGLAYLRDEKVHHSGPRTRIPPDSLPQPAWHLFDLEPYFQTADGYGVRRGRSMPIVASRGCGYHCRFCSSARMWSFQNLARTPAIVVDEIESYIAKYAVNDIHFLDMSLGAQKEWFPEFCHEIQRRGLSFTWQLPTGVRPEHLTPEVLANMHGTGCLNIAFSPESGSERTLRSIHKGFSLKSTVATIRAAKKARMHVKCNFIIGFPDETASDIRKTAGLVLRLAWYGVDDAGVYIFTPYTGNDIHQELIASGVIQAAGHGDRLSSYMDLTTSRSVCREVSSSRLQFWRVATMFLFYTIGFITRPYRIVRLIVNWAGDRSDTVFEQRFVAAIRRLRMATTSTRSGTGNAGTPL